MRGLKALTLVLLFTVTGLPGAGAETWLERLRERRKERFTERWVQKKETRQKELLAQSGDSEYFLIHKDLKRRYIVHAPKNGEGPNALPVVLVLHGGIGTPEGTAEQSGMNAVADKNGFLAVYPQGLGDYPTWNGGYCCGYAKDHHIDDVGFIRVLLKDLASNYSIDSERVYSTGISNGAIMSYRLADELSDKIAAIGPIAGDMDIDLPPPQRPVPIIHFHGMKDYNLPYDGGAGPRGLFKGKHPGFPKTLERWIRANNCGPNPVKTVKTEDYEMLRFEPAPGQKGAPIVLYKLFEGGHTWPGGVDITKKLRTGRLIENVDASSLMWDFFKQYKIED